MTPSTRTAAAIEEAAANYDADTLWRYIQRGLGSKHTVRAYQKKLTDWVSFCHERGYDLLRPPPGSDAEYLAVLARRGYGNGSVHIFRASAVALYDLFLQEGLLFVPFRGARVGPTRAQKRHRHTPDEVRRMLDVSNATVRFAILCHAELGLRSHHAVSLEWTHVHGDYLNTPLGLLKMSAHMGGVLQRVGTTRGRILPYGSKSRHYRRIQASAEKAGITFRGTDALRYVTSEAQEEAA